MSDFREFDWIKSLPQSNAPDLKVGIGDDAAVFRGESDWVISTDSLVENSHFLSSDSPKLAAQKLVRVNLSDMAAMGCQACFFLMNFHQTPSWNEKQIMEFKSGLIDELKQWGLSLIGGDTVSAKQGPIHLVGTVIGKPFNEQPILRSGAQIGDSIYITGALGGSFPNRHLNFTPRIEEARKICLNSSPNAMMDISDGLLQDLGHILDQSKVSAELELFKVPIHEDVPDGPHRLEKALSDGEDFELLFTIPNNLEEKLPKDLSLTKIGKIVQGQSEIFARKSPYQDFNVWPRLGFEHTAT